MTTPFVPPTPTDQPELFFALVAATGTDLEAVTRALEAELGTVGYRRLRRIRLSHLVHGLEGYQDRAEQQVAEDLRISTAMDTGDEVRRSMEHGGALAALAVNELKRLRESEPEGHATAYVFRSLKHPKEVDLLRGIYGSSLLVISVYDSEAERRQRLENRIKRSRDEHLARGEASTWSSTSPQDSALALMGRDQADPRDPEYGQNVRKTFPLADFFLDASSGELRPQVSRLIHILFNHPHMSPNRGEYAMFMAHAAALRSADMSRQVGAVIIDEDGEPVATGCNEVPKPTGGVYWSGEAPDHRDFHEGSDPNAIIGREVLQEIFSQLKGAGWLSESIANKDADALVEDARRRDLFERARVGNLIEFGRVVHAEMNALLHAARQGLAVRDRVLYCTTFPCHGCARHIIGAGIARVVYIEPYPKSLAARLYPEAIKLSADAPGIPFDPFTGVAPRRYLDFFGFGRRKDAHGYATDWIPERARPRIRPLSRAWLLAEQQLCGSLLKALRDRDWI